MKLIGMAKSVVTYPFRLAAGNCPSGVGLNQQRKACGNAMLFTGALSVLNVDLFARNMEIAVKTLAPTDILFAGISALGASLASGITLGHLWDYFKILGDKNFKASVRKMDNWHKLKKA